MNVKLRASSWLDSLLLVKFSGQKLNIGPKHIINVAPGINAISLLKNKQQISARIESNSHNGKVIAKIAGMEEMAGDTIPPYADEIVMMASRLLII